MLETYQVSIPRKLEDGWEPIIKMKLNEAWNIKNYRYVGDVSASPSLVPARPRVGKR